MLSLTVVRSGREPGSSSRETFRGGVRSAHLSYQQLELILRINSDLLSVTKFGTLVVIIITFERGLTVVIPSLLLTCLCVVI